MKKILILLMAVLAICSCRDVDYFYPADLIYINQTNHLIHLKIDSDLTIDTIIEPLGSYKGKWGGTAPFSFYFYDTAEITFDNKFSIEHKFQHKPEYHNVCSLASYESRPMKKTKWGKIYTFHFTEEDYNYAVSNQE